MAKGFRKSLAEGTGSGLGFGTISALSEAATKALTGDASGAVGEAAGGAVAGAAIPLMQQGVSIVNARNDESVLLALLSRLRDDGDGGDNPPPPASRLTLKQKLKKWQLLNSQLSSNQVSELRKIIVNLALPERFEQFLHKEQIPVQAPQDASAQQGNQGRGGQPKNRVNEFTRVLKDYEFVTDPEAEDQDYRIGMIEMLLHMDDGPSKVTEAAKFVKQMIAELSATEKVKKQADKVAVALYRIIAAYRLGPKYKDTMTMSQVFKALEKENKGVEQKIAALKTKSVMPNGWFLLIVGLTIAVGLLLISASLIAK